MTPMFHRPAVRRATALSLLLTLATAAQAADPAAELAALAPEASAAAGTPADAGAEAVTLPPVDVVGAKPAAAPEFGVKSGIPVDKQPQSVQLLNPVTLTESSVRSIDDALLAVPSATVARSRVVSSASGAPRLRGLVADQMRNGLRQRFYNGVDNAALSNIERIEVLKGPSGVLFGQAAVGGLVSVVTKQPTDAFAGSVALTAGSHGQKLATVDVGGPITDTLGLRLTGEIERSGSFVDHLDLDRENLGLSLAWQPSVAVSAHLVAEYLARRSSNYPGLPTVGTVLPNGVARVRRSTFLGEPAFSVQNNHAPLLQAWVDVRLNDSWTLTPRLQYSEFNNRGNSTHLLAPDPSQPTLIPRDGRDGGEKDNFTIAQLDLAGRFATFGIGHRLLVGVERAADEVPFTMYSEIPCGIGPIDALNPVYGCGAPSSNFGFRSRADLESYSVYVQDQIALTPAWNVVTGVRHTESDNDNSFSTAFFTSRNSAKLRNTAWQLGSTYALSERYSLFGGYSTGYSLEDVTGSRKFDGSAFKPQTSNQAELGLRYGSATAHLSLAAFRSHLDNVSVADPANVGFQLQDGRFRIQGIELEGEWTPLPGWSLQGGYAYLDGIVQRSSDPAQRGARLAETPESSVVVASRVRLGAVDLRAGVNYAGARKVLNGGAVTLPDYATLDLGASTGFGAFRIDAALTNVFDQTYYYSDNVSRYSLGTDNRVLPGQPRSFSVRVGYRFGAART